MFRVKVFLSLALMIAVGAHAQCAAACLGADSDASNEAMTPKQSCHEETEGAPSPPQDSPSHAPNACAGSLDEAKIRSDLKPLLLEVAVLSPVDLMSIWISSPGPALRLDTRPLDSALAPSPILRI
jgi:hypothetical protein